MTYVCSHLAAESYVLGFNRDDPSEESLFPDAWCDGCEIIRAAHDGWNDESQELVKLALICAECYERTRIRNSRPSVTLDDLERLRWKCGSCDEWHHGPCLDFGYDAPHYWNQSWERGVRWSSSANNPSFGTFLDSDYCAIEDRDFFVRGVLHIPILGAAESLRWGVWGSLSRQNFEALLRADENNGEPESKEMFSWLSTRIPEYPDTLSLKMFAVIQEPGTRPYFRLERADHPLAKEYHEGIQPERVKEIMFKLLPGHGD